jgi:hypothetical protein
LKNSAKFFGTEQGLADFAVPFETAGFQFVRRYGFDKQKMRRWSFPVLASRTVA